MDHLYNSVVKVERMQMTMNNGRAEMTWQLSPAPGSNWVKCRLDLNFLRPGKDVPAAINAGVVPDRIGIMFTYPDAPLKAGDRITAIPNEYGNLPVSGVFDIKQTPDQAIDYSNAHHIEVQIVESISTTENTFGEENTK